MVNFGTTKSGKQDAIQNAQGEIDNVRGIMSQNIETLLERGERIDLLVDKTDRLGGSAHEFRVRSRGLRRQMWWKSKALYPSFIMQLPTNTSRRQIDGAIDCGDYFLTLPIYWIWLRTSRLGQMHREW